MHDLLSADKWLKVWTYRETFLNGLLNTVETAVVALLLSFAIGVVIGLMSTSGKKALRAIARVYVEIIQNTPLLLQVLFLYYALAFSGHSLGVIRTGMIGLGIYHGAYMAEVIRAGITAIPAGQFDAAHSQGFGYVGLMYHIIIPQTIKIILPPMVNRGSHLRDIQLRHRRADRRRVRAGLSCQRHHLLCRVLPALAPCRPLGGQPQAA